MDWIALTLNDLATVLTPGELSAHRTLAAPVSGDVDPVLTTMNQCIGEVVGFVGACHRNTTGPDGKIPGECYQAALDLIASRIPVGTSDNASKKELRRSAYAFLERVGRCLIAISPPSTPNAIQPTGGTLQIARRSNSRLHRHSLDGL